MACRHEDTSRQHPQIPAPPTVESGRGGVHSKAGRQRASAPGTPEASAPRWRRRLGPHQSRSGLRVPFPKHTGESAGGGRETSRDPTPASRAVPPGVGSRGRGSGARRFSASAAGPFGAPVSSLVGDAVPLLRALNCRRRGEFLRPLPVPAAPPPPGRAERSSRGPGAPGPPDAPFPPVPRPAAIPQVGWTAPPLFHGRHSQPEERDLSVVGPELRLPGPRGLLGASPGRTLWAWQGAQPGSPGARSPPAQRPPRRPRPSPGSSGDGLGAAAPAGGETARWPEAQEPVPLLAQGRLGEAPDSQLPSPAPRSPHGTLARPRAGDAAGTQPGSAGSPRRWRSCTPGCAPPSPGVCSDPSPPRAPPAPG
uniref:uncharacterized protein LOC128929184 n=1 Tax=Callithrix jacchus TaxID=9483 RepID=UPI0023DD47FE|nr:uncharacterized protein LOC128929184 [Callithrix jacchus]